MLNIGFWELFLIVIVGLLAVGPKQLPEVAKQVARAVRKIRRTTDELRDSAREVVHEVIPPEDLYGYGDDDKRPPVPGTTPYGLEPPPASVPELAPPEAAALAPPKEEGPSGGDSSLGS